MTKGCTKCTSLLSFQYNRLINFGLKLVCFMKVTLFTLVCVLFTLSSSAQQVKQSPTTLKKQIVEASCGECKFGLEGKSCELAVRVDKVAYFVDGFKIDDFGDAHGKHGFCNAIRKAEVTGTIENGRFKATAFKLLPEKKK